MSHEDKDLGLPKVMSAALGHLAHKQHSFVQQLFMVGLLCARQWGPNTGPRLGPEPSDACAHALPLVPAALEEELCGGLCLCPQGECG